LSVSPAVRRIVLVPGVLFALALAISACGAKQDTVSAARTKPFTVMLDWFPNADHAPLYSAIANGDFHAVGLDARPVVPSETAEPLKLLATGKVDMAISY
jgi:putative hydroxymethylpyrimidine transport system substrate-binding protein